MTETTYEQPPAWVEKIRAIGIDTNAIGRGEYNESQLRELARQSNEHGGIELWIAEPVVWEWAEHLHRTRTEFNKQRTNLKGAGIEVAAQPAELLESLKFVEQAVLGLGENVKIVPIGPVAVEALKDQVLVRDPGERVLRNPGAKSSRHLKTGAADSAIYRAYNHHAHKKSDQYVVLSNDKDVERAHKAWGFNVKIVKLRDELNDDVFRMIPAPEYLVKECVALMFTNLSEFDLTAFFAREGGATEDGFGPFTAIGERQLVGLHNIKVDKKAQVIAAEACIVSDLLVPYFEYENVDSGARVLSDSPTELSDAAIFFDVTFVLKDKKVTAVNMGSVRTISADALTAYPHDDDGPYPVLENVPMIPGLSDFDWADDNYFYRDATKEITVDGDLLSLVFSRETGESWSLSALYRGRSVEVSGTLLETGSHHDNSLFSGLVELNTDSEQVAHHPALAINALVMNTPKED